MSTLQQVRPSLRSALFGILVVVAGAVISFEQGLFAQRDNRVINQRRENPADFPNAFHNLAQQALPGIVSIEAMGRGGVGRKCRVPGPFHSRGTGFVLDPGNIILTNTGLVTGAERVRIRTRDGEEIWATSMSLDPLSNLALVRLPLLTTLPSLPLADSDAAQIGDWVMAVGNPGLRSGVSDLNASAGIISGRGPLPDFPQWTDFLETDAQINSNNSGGPVLNLNGQVVGLTTIPGDADELVSGPGYIIPSNQIQWLSQQWANNGPIRRSYLGLRTQALSTVLARQLMVPNNRGVVVTQVAPTSPAALANVRAGDVIVALNQRDVTDPQQLHVIGERLPLGKTYPLDVIRDGKRTPLKIVPAEMVYPPNLAPRTVTLQQGLVVNSPRKFSDLGITASETTLTRARQLGFKDPINGVMIDAVEPDSAAANAGLRPGMVLEQVGKHEIKTLADFESIQNEAPTKNGLLLRVRTPREPRFVVVTAG